MIRLAQPPFPKTFLNKKPLGKMLLVLAVISVMGLVLFYIFVGLPGPLTLSEAAEGRVTHEEPVVLLIANTETLVLSPVNGTPVYRKSDGSRFRRGEKIADVGREQLTAPAAGLYFASKDGLEGLVTPGALKSMDLQKLVAEITVVMPDMTKILSGTEENRNFIPMSGSRPIATVSVNGVAGKMVNNQEASWAFVWLPDTMGGSMAKDIAKGDPLQFKVGESYQKAYVERVSDTPKGVVVRFAYFLEDSRAQRMLQAIWVRKEPQYGIIVPVSAIVYQGEGAGIYVMESGVIVFKEGIRVIDHNDEWACIEGIEAETQVVENPRPGIKGRKIK
ncbi:MAG: hypothetical protein FWG14_06125 [Peptococcaceae bacterium]|nr:hypothetical protein [Peptococcaceae bacterium]